MKFTPSLSVLLLCGASLVAAEDTQALPTAIFHGFGDQCINPGMAGLTKDVARQTGAHAECIEIGAVGSVASIFENFETQAETACKKVKENPKFKDTKFNVMGLSQGSLIARYIAQTCDTTHPVNNVLSIGGPNMGVEATPHCFTGPFCKILNTLVGKAVYFKAAQDFVGPAGYFRDPHQYSTYLQDSVFLPYLNNEKQHDGFDSNKERFVQVNSMLLVQFNKDTMIYPKETAVFASLDVDGKLIPMEEQDVYKNDTFGLKTLADASKIHQYFVDGDHLRFSQSDLVNVFIPFLITGKPGQ